MSNRMLRSWVNSEKVNSISVHAERFFTRLIMVVDDFGCFYANTMLLRANLFPLLLDSVKESDLVKWLAECQKVGLLVIYQAEGKKYLKIIDFKQRLDRAKSKFPQPVNDSQETVNDFPAIVNEIPPEVERNTKENTNTKEKGKEGFAPPALDEVISYMSETIDEFSAMGEAKKFINYYSSNGWMVGKNKMKSWRGAAAGWLDRRTNFKNKEDGQRKLGTSEQQLIAAKNF